MPLRLPFPARLVALIAAVSMLMTGCNLPLGTPPVPEVGTQTATAAAPGLPTPATVTPPPTAPAVTPTPPPTVTPAPTLHPMTIAAQRQGSYPGSAITVESELEAGANYRRYYAFYLSEGYRIYGLLTVPEGDAPPGGFPAIVFNHGYIAPAVYRTTERYVAYVDRLARAGYIVFRIDYRGHDRSEGEASGAYGDPGYLIDVLNAAASLRQFPAANPERIGMWGHSMGGYLTLRAMVVSADIRAGVIWAGVVGSYPDMLYNWHRARSQPAPTAPAFARRWRERWLEDYGTPEENPAFWDSVSANAYLNQISGPVQLHHGTADSDVPPLFSETLSQQITAAGGVAELYTYDGDDHNLSNYFTTAMDRTVEFFDRYLK